VAQGVKEAEMKLLIAAVLLAGTVAGAQQAYYRQTQAPVCNGSTMEMSDGTLKCLPEMGPGSVRLAPPKAGSMVTGNLQTSVCDFGPCLPDCDKDHPQPCMKKGKTCDYGSFGVVVDEGTPCPEAQQPVDLYRKDCVVKGQNEPGAWECKDGTASEAFNPQTICDDRELLKADSRIIHNQDELIKSYERKIAKLKKQLESYAALKKQADQITAQQDLLLKALTRGCTLTCGTECFDGQPCNKEGK
jgi:hypothetical protein